MSRVILFGGSAEGRELLAACSELEIPHLYCVATEDGARSVEALPGANIRVGRLDAAGIGLLLREHAPRLVIDATHPYAVGASKNISLACQSDRVPMLRVLRDMGEESGCVIFAAMEDMLPWLAQQPGNIFVTTGSSHAAVFTRLPDYQNRIWLRILPSMESLRSCLDLGYRPERLVCMQGPFSEELNRAMFQAAEARILVTKNSGAAGGFPEKARAAASLGMRTAVLARPEEAGGVTVAEVLARLRELRI